MKNPKKIAMIGGSFNPVTRAHVELGKIARKELGKEWQILYVPAPDRFLASWKELNQKDILSGQQRLSLLKKAVEAEGFACEECEMLGKTSARTFDTISYLREMYGEDTECFYVCGTDKLFELERWYQAEKLLEIAGIFVIPREEDDPEQMIRECPFLAQRADRIRVSHEPRMYPDFSSTKVRESMRAGDDLWREMVPEAVAEDMERLYKVINNERTVS